MANELHPTIQRIKDAGPEWARFLRSGRMGLAWWQSERGNGPGFRWDYGRLDEVCRPAVFDPDAPFCIDLTTGAIHLQDASGHITIVPQDEWVAEGGL
jgi:hypothetical protein